MGKTTYEKNLNRYRRRIILVTLSGILVAAILTFLFAFRITEVTVEGNVHYTDEEVKSMAMDGIFSSNSLLLSMTKKNQKIENVPFMDSVSVEMTGRDSVCIVVSEKNIVGYIEYDNACWYFDREGIVAEKSDQPVQTAEERAAGQKAKAEKNAEDTGMDGVVTPAEEGKEDSADQEESGEDQIITPAENVDGAAAPDESGVTSPIEAKAPVKNYIPLVQGLVFETITLGKELKVKNPGIFDTLSSLNQMINKDNIPPDFVMFDEESNIFLYYGTVEVCLGKDEQLEEKMNTLASIKPEMEGLSGTLHLENYSEAQNGVVFRKN